AAPAEARCIHSRRLRRAEAALTGESLPVAKDVDTISVDAALGDRTNMIYSGTSATYGPGPAVGVAPAVRHRPGDAEGQCSWRPACEPKWVGSPACFDTCRPSTRRCRKSSIMSAS